jgi:hypothetical protein
MKNIWQPWHKPKLKYLMWSDWSICISLYSCISYPCLVPIYFVPLVFYNTFWYILIVWGWKFKLFFNEIFYVSVQLYCLPGFVSKWQILTNRNTTLRAFLINRVFCGCVITCGSPWVCCIQFNTLMTWPCIAIIKVSISSYRSPSTSYMHESILSTLGLCKTQERWLIKT